METEKTSYTLNHNGEEEKVPKSESYEPLLEDAPAETDKMLEKPEAEVKKSTEVLAEADETTALDEKKDEAIKETPAVPVKNRILQFFERKPKQPQPEPAETHNGNGTAAEAVDGDAEPANPPKRKFIPLNLKNPFAKKVVETPVPDAEEKDKPTVEASSSDEKKGEFPRLKALLTEIFIDFLFLLPQLIAMKKRKPKPNSNL